MHEAVAQVDLESRSECSLKNCGAWRYAADATTQVMCLAWRLPHWQAGRTGLWHPEFPAVGLAERFDHDAVELFAWVQNGRPVEAHNSAFERAIWQHKMLALGFPAVGHTQWRCSMAKASAAALPRALDDAAAALGLSIVKSATGAANMKKMVQPRKAVKAERTRWAQIHDPCLDCNATGKLKTGRAKAVPCEVCNGTGAMSAGPPMPVLYHETRQQLEDLFAYCRQDVLAEEALSAAVPDLSAEELAVYHLDQAVNARGFQLDMQAVHAALTMLAAEAKDLNAEIAVITGGAVTRATQRARVIGWLASQGVVLDNTQAQTVDEALKDVFMPEPAHRVLTILRALGRSSTSKYERMTDWAGEDGRVRGGMLYHGASTGRWPLTGDHECLTPNGWVRMDEWTGGSIACWRPGGSMSFENAKPIEFWLQPGETLCHIKTQKVDQVSTSDHAMPVWLRARVSEATGRKWGGRFERKLASDISPGDGMYLCGRIAPSSAFADELTTRILVMTQADGHYITSDGRCLVFGFRKARKISRCVELLRRAGIPFTQGGSEKDAVRIRVPRITMPDWLWAFREKVFSWDWLNVDTNVFFDELVRWDGSKSSPNGMEYTSTCKQNTDVVQALAHISDRTCGVRRLDRADHGWNTAWRCCIDLDPNPSDFRRRHRTYIDPAEPTVYCAETPTGYFLVRRNGRAWITGNSGAGIQPHNFPRGVPSLASVTQEDLWAAVLTGDREQVRALAS